MAARAAQREARARALLLVLGGLYAAVFLALFSLQVVQGGHYREAALRNRQTRVRVPAPRGVISDRNGIALADNQYQARITLEPSRAREGEPVFERLLELLELPRELALQRIARARPGEPVVLVRHADPEDIAIVEEHRELLPHVRLTVQPRRRYRFGPLASHLLGYMGEVREEELAGGFYERGDLRGRSGIEAFAEPLLRGVHGSRVVEVNAAGHVVGELREGGERVTPGDHLFLTLSQPLQARLEELLEGKPGAGVVMEVATGDILAMASSPTYDPNLFAGGLSAADWAKLDGDPRTPMLNRATMGLYAPGSPFKLITAAAALERDRVRRGTTFEPCLGGWQFGNRRFRCWDRSGHGTLDLMGAIAQSCDVYFYQLIERLEMDELAETARRFGIGQPTGIELSTEEEGRMPERAYYDRRFGRRGWTRGVMLNLAIGQGEIESTPLQMVRAFAAIGGDGHLYRPNLLLAKQNLQGVREARLVRRSAEPVCSERVRAILREALVQVVEDVDGTGELARVSGVRVAGKTGTSENSQGEDHAWFVAYAPADHPEVAAAVLLEHAGHGGEMAAPVVGALLGTYFEWQQAAVRAPSDERAGR